MFYFISHWSIFMESILEQLDHLSSLEEKEKNQLQLIQNNIKQLELETLEGTKIKNEN